MFSIDREAILQAKSIDYAKIIEVTEIVKGFIIENEFIIYGGQAIDYALRAKGDKLYSDIELPDLDFYSPDNVKAAYDLVELLHERGYKDPGAIKALHPQTMRVKFDSIFIADITYVPPKVFNTLPTIKYEDMKVIHPHFQLLDMHLSLFRPSVEYKMSNLINRLKKDISRYNMLVEHYPLPKPPKEKPKMSKKEPKHEEGLIIYGINAYNLIVSDEIAPDYDEYIFVNRTDAVNKLLKKCDKVLAPLLEARQKVYIDEKNKAKYYDFTDQEIFIEKIAHFTVAGIQGVMLYMLERAINGENGDPYSGAMCTQSLLHWHCYHKLYNEACKREHLILDTMGTNLSEARKIKFLQQLAENNEEYKAIIGKFPKTFHIESTERPAEPGYDSEFYKRDGQELT